ncbi:MAG: SRPBCC family protein [Actinomycetota bacterium]|nr:SRPBCC family protein [Actinomycetota bacterium]
MDMEHSFTVAAPIAEVWTAFLEPARVAPCFPGATLTSSDEKSFTGTVKVKLGPIAMLYKGVGEFVDTDEATHTATIDAKGKDSRGNGQANAKVTAVLTETGAHSTDVVVKTDLSITGKPAQMGRGLIVEVGGKIIGQFADCLSQRLGVDATGTDSAPVEEPAEVAAAAAAPQPDARPKAAVTELKPRTEPVYPPTPDAIDLLDSGGSAVLKRVAPVLAGVALGAVVVWLIKR